ncbi:MAG: radical SAM protein [Desulfovibrionaceae bacterium]|nr:radical SAM protein [Desulfovibrionaceae bacterium]
MARRAERAVALLAACTLCPRRCGADRLHGEHGLCGGSRHAAVASYGLHHGEEAPISGPHGSGTHGSGKHGSGTVFFAGCNLGCAFCQNHDISAPAAARDPATRATPEELAAVFLDLQRRGAHNVNLVTPSHMVPQILEALCIAVPAGLDLPLVYNSSGYDAPETLELLAGVVDIHMPDAKFWDPATAARLCRDAADYPQVAREAIAAMHAQVGDLILDRDGVAVSGLLVRHLVLPGGLAGTAPWMAFLARLSPATWVNVMDQYHPCSTALDMPELAQPPSVRELDAARRAARDAGLTRLDPGHERRAEALLRALLCGPVRAGK